MPGAVEAGGDWTGREPWVVIAARALAPWPLWLVLWQMLSGDQAHGSLFVFAATAVVVGLMVRRASRGADAPVSGPALLTAVSLAFGGNILFAFLASIALPRTGLAGLGWAPASMLAWLVGAASYELAKRCFTRDDLAPPRRVGVAVDVVAHQVLLVAALAQVVDVRGGGVPLPLLVGPLVAVRVVGWHDARMPAPSRTRLGTRTVLGAVAVVILVAALIQPRAGVPAPSGALVSVILAAAVSALLAAVTLVARAGRAGGSLWGVVYEQRADGLVLSVRRGPARVHVVPKDPRPGGGIPAPDSPITLIDVEPVASPEVPYRQGPPMVRARVAWRGTADELAATLLARAWGWVAWSALSFAAAVLLLG